MTPDETAEEWRFSRSDRMGSNAQTVIVREHRRCHELRSTMAVTSEE
jgi:hypothetical protein